MPFTRLLLRPQQTIDINTNYNQKQYILFRHDLLWLNTYLHMYVQIVGTVVLCAVRVKNRELQLK